MPRATIQAIARAQGRAAGREPSRPIDARYGYRRGEHELVLTGPEVEEAMVEAVARGEPEFALIIEESFLGLCVRFGDAIPWVCAFYQWQAVPAGDRGFLDDEARLATRVALDVSLVEAGNGAVRAERCVTLSMDFSQALLVAIREQSRLRFAPTESRSEMARLRRSCPTPAALAASTAIRTRGVL